MQRKISGSLDDLHVGKSTKDEGKKGGRFKDKSRSRTQVITTSTGEGNDEGNRLAEILDSIKKASQGQQGLAKSPSEVQDEAGRLLSPNYNKSGLQKKSYSYSSLDNLKLDDEGKTTSMPDTCHINLGLILVEEEASYVLR